MTLCLLDECPGYQSALKATQLVGPSHSPARQGKSSQPEQQTVGLCCTGFMLYVHVGNLALSRAIGDFNLKSNRGLPQAEQAVTGKQLTLRGTHLNYIHALMKIESEMKGFPPHPPLIANPEVMTVDITPDHEFMVLACDGECTPAV